MTTIKLNTQRIVALALSLTLALLSTGCDIVRNKLTGTMSDEEMYHTLDTLIDHPTAAMDSPLLGEEISFSAYIFTEAFEDTLYGEDGTAEDGVFQYVKISRNDNDLILVNVEQISNKPSPGDYVTITGAIVGFVEYEETLEEESNESLEVFATDIRLLEDKEVTLNRTHSFIHQENDITFLQASLYEHNEDEYLVLFFDYTNNGDTAISPTLSGLEFYQGNVFLVEDMAFAPSDFGYEGSNAALSAAAPGETVLFYQAFLPYEAKLSTEDLEIFAFDDDFQVVYVYSLPLSA